MKRLLTPLLVCALLLAGALAVLAWDPSYPGTGKTDIYLMNIGTNPASVTLSYSGMVAGDPDTYTGTYELSSGIQPLYSKMIPSWVTGTLDLPSDWQGAVEVASSDALAAVGAMLWDKTTLPKKYTAGIYKGFDTPAQVQHLPFLVFSDATSPTMTSEVTVQNTEAEAVDVTFTYLNASGTEVLEFVQSVPAGQQVTDKLGVDHSPDFSATGGQGSVVLTAPEGKKIAAVASLHWGPGKAPISGSSDCYSSVSVVSSTLYFPGAFRYSPRYTDVYIKNVGDTDATVDIRFRSTAGALHSTAKFLTQTIAAGRVFSFTTSSTALPISKLGAYWKGSIEVYPTAGVSQDPPQLVGAEVSWQKSGVKDLIVTNAIMPVEASTWITGVRGLAFPFVIRNRAGTGKAYSDAFIRNLSGKAGYATVWVYWYKGTVLKKYKCTVNVPKYGQAEINLSGKSALGTMNVGAMQVIPAKGQTLVGVNRVFWDATGVGRAGGYTGFLIPGS